MNQVKDILRKVIKYVNKPKCPVEDDWHERLNCDLMTVTRRANQKGRKRINKSRVGEQIKLLIIK